MNIIIWANVVAILMLDKFIDANATPLQSHTINVGSGWTLQGPGGTAASVFTGSSNPVLFDQSGKTGTAASGPRRAG